MKLRFIAGQRLLKRCVRCDAKRYGTVYRDLYSWRIRYECGHERDIGFVRPMDVLEAENLIET